MENLEKRNFMETGHNFEVKIDHQAEEFMKVQNIFLEDKMLTRYYTPDEWPGSEGDNKTKDWWVNLKVVTEESTDVSLVVNEFHQLELNWKDKGGKEFTAEIIEDLVYPEDDLGDLNVK